MTNEEFRIRLRSLLLRKTHLSSKGKDTKEIDNEIKQIEKEYKQSLIAERMSENGKYKTK